MQKRLPFLFGLLIVIILLGTQSLFVVHQTERALVIQLGDPVDEVFGPGLHFKIPFIQEVVRFNARVLDYEARPAEALTSDKKTIVLDNYARWRIVDPLKFYRTVRTIPGAQARLDVSTTLRSGSGGTTQPYGSRVQQAQRHHDRCDSQGFRHHEGIRHRGRGRADQTHRPPRRKPARHLRTHAGRTENVRRSNTGPKVWKSPPNSARKRTESVL